MPQQVFTVEGTGHFPFDMLRYDGCYPSTETDTGRMLASDSDVPRVITMARYVNGRREQPTTARWKSFGWRVLESQTR